MLDFLTNCNDLCQLTVATSRRTMYIPQSLSSEFCRTLTLSQDRTTQIHKETFTVTLQKYSPKNKYFFASFNDNRGLSLDDKTKACVDRNVGGQVESLHEVTQLD